MAKIISWNDKDWEMNLKERLDRAVKFREIFEGIWAQNYRVMGNDANFAANQFNVSFDNLIELEGGEVDSGDSQIGINEIFKYTRFWHSQMSANPPSVIVRPRSSDPTDRRKADAADRISRFLRKDKNMGEVIDSMNLSALITGTGYTVMKWDPEKGDMYDVNEETQEVQMEGDHCTYSPKTEDVWIDPDARNKDDVRWYMERHLFTVEEAQFKFPDHAEKIKESITDRESVSLYSIFSPEAGSEESNLVEVMEYCEKGMPINGGVGRHAYFLSDATILSRGPNKHYKARLPIKILTYIDLPGQVYGKSVIDYTSRLQDMLNRLDSSNLDAIQAHGTVRMAVHESTDLEDESVSNSNWDYIKYGGNQAPHFIPAPSLMPDIWRFREALALGIRELFGINDAMLGIQRREQSAVSQQTSIESGTMVHRRLMTKYAKVVEEIYQDGLGIVKEHWTTPRQVLVLGEEKAFEAADFSGADIAGGFDLDVEYGTSLPLDPNMAREQLMLLMPALKEAGLSMKQILKRFKLNELESTLDIMELASDRQREIFEEMVASSHKGELLYIAPRELEEHQGMLEYAYVYVMTSEFKYLGEDIKRLVEKHIKAREQLAAQAAAPTPGEDPQGVQALPGAPGVSGAITPELMEAPPPEGEIV